MTEALPNNHSSYLWIQELFKLDFIFFTKFCRQVNSIPLSLDFVICLFLSNEMNIYHI